MLPRFGRSLRSLLLISLMTAMIAPIAGGTLALDATDSTPTADESSTSDSTTDLLPDQDGDTIADDADNCPEIANPDQVDADGNSTGDACAPDVEEPAVSALHVYTRDSETSDLVPGACYLLIDEATGEPVNPGVCDDDDDILPASCITFKPYEAPGNQAMICDGSPAALGSLPSDGNPDGHVDVAGLAPGRWLITGSEAGGSVDPAPLPLVVAVQAGNTTNATLVFWKYGALDIRLLGPAEQSVSGCATLGYDWEALGGDLHPYGDAFLTKVFKRCDEEDGARDGLIHYPELPVGIYWIYIQTEDSTPQFGSFERFTIKQGQTTFVTSYLPNAQLTVNVVDSETGELPTGFRIVVLQYVDSTHHQFVTYAQSGQTLTLPTAAYRVFTDDAPGEPHPYHNFDSGNPVTLTVSGVQRTIEIKLTRKIPATPTPTPTPTKTPTKTPTQPPAANPACTVSKTSGWVGSSITVTCTGYQAKEKVNVHWDAIGTDALGAFTANSSGAGKVTIKIPTATRGNHKLIARGAKSGKRITTTVVVSPRILLSPGSDASGSTFTVKVTGFKAGEKISVRWYNPAGTAYKTLKSNVSASPTGQVNIKVAVPTGATAGWHGVGAIGNTKTMAFSDFNVTAQSAKKAAISVPAAAHAANTLDRAGFNLPHDTMLNSTERRRLVRRLPLRA